MLVETVGVVAGAVVLTEGIICLSLYFRDPPRHCAHCDEMTQRWADEVLRRNKEWEALLRVAQRLTHKPQADLVGLTVRELDKVP